MGIPLILEKGQLDALKRHAEEHPIGLSEMLDIENRRAALVGERPGHKLELTTKSTGGVRISFGWTVAHSIEEHRLKDGSGTVWLRHMSMALAVPGRYPNRYALEMVAQELGFPPLAECVVQGDPGTPAVAVLAVYQQTPK